MTSRPHARPQVSYLRVSVTDRCNERCVYCMPADGVPLKTHDQMLSYEELARIIRCAVPLGVQSVRLTGGEPLVRRGIAGFAASVTAIPGIEDLAVTTNGTLLGGSGGLATDLRRAGVGRINISLDSLRPERYRSITRRGAFGAAWEGVEAALAAGFEPVKINTVVIRGLNDDEIEDMALIAAEGNLVWRFIELMPLGEARDLGPDALVPADEIIDRLASSAARHRLIFAEDTSVRQLRPAAEKPLGAGPARYFRLGRGRVGVISPMTHGFCSTCNRLRLTSEGRLHPCLTSTFEIDIAAPLRAGASDAELTELLAGAVDLKPQAHRMRDRHPDLAERRMSRIGG